jgi:hypothetical protein
MMTPGHVMTGAPRKAGGRPPMEVGENPPDRMVLKVLRKRAETPVRGKFISETDII